MDQENNQENNQEIKQPTYPQSYQRPIGFCPKCGQKLYEGQVFCNSCGMSFRNTPPAPVYAPPRIEQSSGVAPVYAAPKAPMGYVYGPAQPDTRAVYAPPTPPKKSLLQRLFKRKG